MTNIKTLPLVLAALCLLSTGTAEAAGDAVKGAQVFKRCTICHTINAGDPNKVGPNLHGLFERGIGKGPGYNNYSEGLKSSTEKWDEAKLDAYLTNPQKFTDGARMAFRVPDAQERQDVIAYLHDAAK